MSPSQTSWQAHCLRAAMWLYVRRRKWGSEDAVARRARHVFGAPPAMQWLRTRDMRIEAVHGGLVRGEWVMPRGTTDGTILYLHGGGYVSCSPATHRPITASLARRTGRRVFALDYRLAPEHRFPAALDDAIAAYRWLLQRGASAASLAFAGESAGGGLVLAALLRIRDENLLLPQCAAVFSPWTDLEGSPQLLARNDGRCMMFRSENVREFADAYLNGASPRNPYASPAFGNFENLPPLLLQAASDELLLEDARRVHEVAQRAGVESRLEIYDGVFHAWHLFDGFMPEAALALGNAARFINRAGASHR